MKFFKIEYVGQYEAYDKLDALFDKFADLMDECIGTEWVGNLNTDWNETKLWHTGVSENDGLYIVMVKNAKNPICIKYRKRWDGKNNVWMDDWHEYEVVYWMPLPLPPEV